MPKLLRTIRLDPSDAFVFPRAAEPGEWAVSGTFLFWDQPADGLIGKERAAFRSGLLGTGSFGWTTLAVIVEASEEERESAIAALAEALMTRFGAPDMASARGAAEAEFADATELAAPAPGTLVAIHRTIENGEIIERFRTLLPGTDERHGRVFSFLEAEDGEIEEAVDLLSLSASKGAVA